MHVAVPIPGGGTGGSAGGTGGSTLSPQVTEKHNPPSALQQQLAAWWREQAEGEINATVPKAAEYGATDLQDIGHQLARTASRTVDNEEATELGIYFYLLGKVGRWTAAISEGRRVSDDTLFDIGVYVRMAQRTRRCGGWPGVAQ